jgi:cytochrome c peroxidase
MHYAPQARRAASVLARIGFALLGLSTVEVASAATTLSLPAQVGKMIFSDKTLSGSGQLACSSCHDPANHYAPSNGLAVQLGGPNMNLTGTRAVPTLTYKDYTPIYSDLAPNPDGLSAPGPGGGFTWDGRADTLAAQAQIPLLAPNEMANTSIQDVVGKLQAASYRGLFEQAFGVGVFGDTATAFADALNALQAYQLEDPSFHPYTSKFDLYSDNKIGGTLTAQEARGLALFNDPARGNCSSCHFSGAGANGSVALFTDFSYEAIGVPRNTVDIKGNALVRGLPLSTDLGLCSRPDHPMPANAQFCGMFKTPTLRNVATRQVFFHNGQIKSLADAVNFYATRDSNPERWYPSVNGVVQKFNDLPSRYQVNIDTQMPLDGRAAGSTPPLSPQDVSDLIAFLGTLTDGYVAPATAPTAVGAKERTR